MWQNIVSGILGFWVVALAFLGFSESLQRLLLIITGIFISFIALGGKHLVRPTEDLIQDIKKIQKKAEEKRVQKELFGQDSEEKEEKAGLAENDQNEPRDTGIADDPQIKNKE